MGKGRGSAAGSLVCYALNITSMDPIKNNFLFERFMSYLRDECPDVDSDVAKNKRAEAIAYLLGKYGEAFVAQIITFSEFKIVNTIKSCMSAFGYPYQEANVITKLIPTTLDGKDTTYNLIEDVALNPEKHPEVSNKDVNNSRLVYEKLKELFVKYPEVYDAVQKLRGVIDHTGMHAGGVVISKEPIIDYIPLTKGTKSAILPLTQLDMDDLHDVFNILKIDVLGVNILAKIKTAMKMANLTFDWYDSEDFSDIETYEMLAKGYTTDVFQLASYGATRIIRQLKTSEFKDVEITDAGNRPGPQAKDKETGKSMMDQIIEAKDSGVNSSLDPRIDDITSDAYGNILYQEHCMLIAQRMAGYDLGGADARIRKPLGKKKKEMMPEVRFEFVYGKASESNQITKDEYDKLDEITKSRYTYTKGDKFFLVSIKVDKNGNEISSPWCKGSIANGYTEEFSHKIFDIMVKFASYCFNKPHSSSYAAIAYKTAYLLKHYPAEYEIACLMHHENQNDITSTLSQCRKFGIKILPPDINKSEAYACMELIDNGKKKEKAIRYGLASISNVGEPTVEVIKACRPFNSFEEFITKTGEYAKKKKGELGKYTNPISKRSVEPLIKIGVFDQWEDNRFKLLNHYNVDIRKDKKYEALDEDKYNRKSKFKFEKELVNTYISEHPLEPFSYMNLDECSNGDKVKITGIVKKAERKKGPRASYGFVLFECKDGTDKKAMLFGKNLEKYKSRCKKGSIIELSGTYNAEYQNINCTVVRTLEAVSKDVDDSDIANLENNLAAEVCLTETPMDDLDELFSKAGA